MLGAQTDRTGTFVQGLRPALDVTTSFDGTGDDSYSARTVVVGGTYYYRLVEGGESEPGWPCWVSFDVDAVYDVIASGVLPTPLVETTETPPEVSVLLRAKATGTGAKTDLYTVAGLLGDRVQSELGLSPRALDTVPLIVRDDTAPSFE